MNWFYYSFYIYVNSLPIIKLKNNFLSSDDYPFTVQSGNLIFQQIGLSSPKFRQQQCRLLTAAMDSSSQILQFPLLAELSSLTHAIGTFPSLLFPTLIAFNSLHFDLQTLRNRIAMRTEKVLPSLPCLSIFLPLQSMRTSL